MAANNGPENMNANTQLPATQTAAMPAELEEFLKDKKETGTSRSALDNLIPLVYVLQAMSPQVQRRNTAAYIEGAEPGSFWLRNAPTPVVSGEVGLLAQPCHFFKDWVEWRPRESGGGFVARHPAVRELNGEDPCPVPDARRVVDPNNSNRIRYLRPNGNEVIMNRNHVVRIFTPDGVLPYLFPFNSTGHVTSKSWVTLINTRSRGKAPAALYRLKTRERSNPLGTWFSVDVQLEEWCSVDVTQDGYALAESFAAGEKILDTPGETTAPVDEIPF